MPSEAQFIQMGLTKDKYKWITVEMVQGFLDNPYELDDYTADAPEVTECFFKYFDWYWTQYAPPIDHSWSSRIGKDSARKATG